MTRIAAIAITVAVVAFSAIVHECAHAYAARALGDDTAERMGRLTLNPLAHLDPFGSIILPLIMVGLGGAILSFAKPVPFDPRRLRHPERDEALVALAGPVSNIAQAAAGTIVLGLLLHGAGSPIASEPLIWAAFIVDRYVFVNLSLAFFNLLPLPPLDGSKLISPLIHGDARRIYHRIQAYSMPVLFLALYILPDIGFDPVGAYLNATVYPMYELLTGWI